MKLKVAIVGASGYSGEELVRLFLSLALIQGASLAIKYI